MEIAYDNDKVLLVTGDCLEVLNELPESFVDCVVTSPPYFGLRFYGEPVWVDGDIDCSHDAARLNTRFQRGKLSDKQASNKGSDGEEETWALQCPTCGAHQREDLQVGREETPDEYVRRLVTVFRGVRRVLKPAGTVWLNLGDSYAGSMKGFTSDGRMVGSSKQRTNAGSLSGLPLKDLPGLKPKDLIGIPWRVAFALQADGWWLRSDIIWHKPNVMPESVRDRPTKCHEYIFLLTKSSKYFYDSKAAQEPLAEASKDRYKHSFGGVQNESLKLRDKPTALTGMRELPAGRNRRTVWTQTTGATKEKHTAAYPVALIEPCILMGCPEDGIVLDPFSGSGTTGVAARKHGREYIGIDLMPEYNEIAARRISE